METAIILLFSSTMTYIGWLFGVAQQIQDSEKEINKAYKEGYASGYAECFRKMRLGKDLN
mgnify:CR=1 FL=1|tara:strand:- start:813 stop:992 length:180 start_codon:yes stop_codon:yes gene_type:complete